MKYLLKIVDALYCCIFIFIEFEMTYMFSQESQCIVLYLFNSNGKWSLGMITS